MENLTELENKSPFLRFLNQFVEWIVKILCVLMVFVIIWALVDVVVHIYDQFQTSYESLFQIETLFTTLGSVLVVLIAIEVFLNIVYFLVKDAINVTLVLSTAITAIARKVIIIDYQTVSVEHMYAAAGLILAFGVAYWLVAKKTTT